MAVDCQHTARHSGYALESGRTKKSARHFGRVQLSSSSCRPLRLQDLSGGTLNTWRSGDDGRPVTERLQVRF
jgi:hypothetical protein